MDRLPPIPTPPSQLWREFRVRLVPLGLFCVAAAVVFWLWQDNLSAPTLLGEVETIQHSVSSPKAGKLAQLNVMRLQRVKAGDLIAQVVTTDPEILQSALAVIQAEIQLLRLNLEPVSGQQRLELTHDRLRLDWMDHRVQLATARVHLQLAEADLKRAEELFKDKVVSQQVLETAWSARESLRAEVEERSRLVAEQEGKLKTLNPSASGSESNGVSPEAVMQASIKVQEEKLRLTVAELSPVQLTAQIDGTVTAVHHRSGEAILAGEPIVTLTALSSDRIVGYIRQPHVTQPRIGMKVEVRPRSQKRCIGHGEIIEVGSQMEPISAMLSPISSANFQEIGLPILVSLPQSRTLLPGEIVDLRILKEGTLPGSRSATEMR